MTGRLAGFGILACFSVTGETAQTQSRPAKARYVDDTPLPATTDEERARGFMLFSRDYLRLVFANTNPQADERIGRLSAFACPGESEPVVLVVRALRNLQHVRVTASDLRSEGNAIPAREIDVRSVRFHLKQGQARWGPFNEALMEVPLFLEKRAGVAVPAGCSQPFWLTIRIPGDTVPGRYTGTVKIEASSGEGAQVPVDLEVCPFKLDEPRGICFAMYTRMRSDPATIAETFADMRAHGMTSIGLCGNSGLPMRVEQGRVRIDWNGQSAIERNMDAYTRAGFPEPMVWLMGSDIPRFCEKIGPLDSKKFADAYRQVIIEINAHGRQAVWPEIIYQPIDEPFEHPDRMPRAMQLLRVLKSIPGVRTENDGMNGRWENFTEECYRLTDVLALHDGPTLHRGRLDMDEWWRFHAKAVADDKRIWFYNIDLTAWHPEPVRFMTGFGLWKSKAHGILEWAYMWPVSDKDPGAVYKQPNALLYRFPKAAGESGGPTIAYEAVREGIDDFRYILTLNRLVTEAKRRGPADLVRLAESVWRPVQAKLTAASFEGCKGRAMQGNWTGPCEILPNGDRLVRGDHKISNNWRFGDYDALRKEISAGIICLRKALDEPS